MINMGALFMSLILMDKKVSEEEKTKQAVVNGVATGGNPAGAIGAILLSQGRVQVEEEKQKLNQEIVAEKTVTNNLRTANSRLTKELEGDPSASPPTIGYKKEVEGDPSAASDAAKVGFRKLLHGDPSDAAKVGYIKEVEGDPSANPPIIGLRKELNGDPSANPPIIGLKKKYEDLEAKNIDLVNFLDKTNEYLCQQPSDSQDDLKRVDHVKALFSLALLTNKDDAIKLHNIANTHIPPRLDKLEPILKEIKDHLSS
jgi:hypothetical protein